MYILTILTCPLKTYVVRLRNLISMNIFFGMKDHSLRIVKRKQKTNRLKKPLKTFFNSSFNEHFLHNKGWYMDDC